MNTTIKEIYEIQNIGKGVINNLTPDNLLKIKETPVKQGFQDVLDEDSNLPYGNNISIEQYLYLDGSNGNKIEINNPSIVSSINPATRIGKGIGNTSTEVSLGFFPTQALFTDGQNNRGLEYPANYEANFTSRSLITKQYLQSQIANIPPADGSETKIISGTTTVVSGNGTISTPYKVEIPNFDGSETKLIDGAGTVVSGNGTISTPYQINIPKNTVINSGFFAGLNVGSTGTLTVGGDVVSAITTVGVTPDSIITVTMLNPMPSTNYVVDIKLQGQSSNLNDDNDVATPVFKPLTTTQFQIGLREISNNSQSLKVHMQVIAY